MNLVLNGMEAMAGLPEEKRRVVVRTGPGDNESVKIAVADSGPGIPVDRLPKLFEPFFTTKKDGMGMGLSIARTIVEAHHGKIWAENNSAGRGDILLHGAGGERGCGMSANSTDHSCRGRRPVFPHGGDSSFARRKV